MSAKKDIVIQDACILFDLVEHGLLNIFFQLELTVITTPQVMVEVENEKQLSEISIYIKRKQIEIDEEGLLEIIENIAENNPGLSFADCSVMESAKRNKATILSSDGSLRKLAVREDISVHGLVWIIERLYEQKIMKTEDAILKLNAYAFANNRAPKKEIEDLIKLIKEQSIQ